MSAIMIGRRLMQLLLVLLLVGNVHAAESKNLAPGFANLPKGASVVLMQPDIELFSLSAGGVPEPKADWTEAALKHVQAAIKQKSSELGMQARDISDKDADELAEINSLHGAIANAISFHHMGMHHLPTKEGKLDWSMGSAVDQLRAKTGSDYALFIWVRDSYSSPERKAAMVALALLGIGITGGFQVGYASLVDLKTGQILWFNQMIRGTGDLREAEPAIESVARLLTNFPDSK